MKNKLIPITCALAALILPACVDRSPMTGSADKGGEPNIIITQPAAKDAIVPVVDTLRQSFTRAAESTSGARVPNPQISILLPDGKTLAVAAPKVDGGLFGSASPKARQARLEALLKALETKLAAGCSGQFVTATVIKDNKTSAFKAGTFSVWAAGGGGNPWTAKEAGPATFVEDRATFADTLSSSQGKGGNFLIVSDAMGTSVVKARPKHPTDHASETETLGDAPLSNVEAKPTGAAQPDAAVAVAPRGGDTIIVDVKNYPATNRSDQLIGPTPNAGQPKLSAISLPQGVAPVGDAIRFATNSAKLTAEGHAAVKRAAELLKKRGDAGRLRLFLVAKADYRSAENHNERLSQKRAEVVQAALFAEGISVERIIAVGESLSPDDTTQGELAGQRTVQLWALPERIAGLSAPTNSLAQQAQ